MFTQSLYPLGDVALTFLVALIVIGVGFYLLAPGMLMLKGAG